LLRSAPQPELTAKPGLPLSLELKCVAFRLAKMGHSHGVVMAYSFIPKIYELGRI